MSDLLILVVHIITTVFRLAWPGGLRAVVAESVLTKHQMLILSRSRRRAAGREAAGFGRSNTDKPRFLRLAEALSGVVSDADCRMILRIRQGVRPAKAGLFSG